ncbi:BZ3500_MvSof-1268-A1-R1_Chr6-1g08388 [Microbotryum saponariae]|uniref:MICOS complex subunit MIC60 n=1 Tax=Microbotryum saponariae TaxID=289078 RepID=A0A2X0NIE2_9BASI|nr:BZ3500_MvSof-1268-A1-R1_Chr6-1g08388 [Microbotryum saponariae]SDA07672.1 BZ3501_MvSof-1269-A2-R1_Chr6-1g08109 [Microbotryum saponariae]
MLRTTAMTGRTGLSSAASRLPSTTMRQALIKRTYATSTTTTTPSKSNVLPIPPNSTSVPPLSTPIVARRSLTRKVLTPLALLAITFYGVSIPLGYTSLRYRDFLVESVPGGELIGDALDKYELDRHHASLTDGSAKVDQALSKPTASGPLTTKSTTSTSSTAATTPTAAGSVAKKETELTRYAESKAKAEGWQLKKGDKADPIKAREEIKAKADQVAQSVSDATRKAKDRAVEKAKEAQGLAQQVETELGAKVEQVKVKVGEVLDKASSAVQKIVPKVEEPESTLPVFAQRPRQLDATPIPPKKAPVGTPYDGPPLPLGFEPAPGYQKPRAPATPSDQLKPVPTPPQPLPLVAPVIKSDEQAASEPMLGQLASTIDALAQFVENSDEGKASAATGVLKGAQNDLKTLAARLQAIKHEGEATLSTSLDRQAKEYSNLLVKAEKDLVDRLDHQEEDWKKAFEDERKKLVEAYKTKLQNELETQQALIDQRLKEEVIAQGVELQRRWVDEIKLKVEEERGGRLAKLDQLEGGIRKLEKVTQGNVESMTMAQKARKLQTAVKAVEHAIESGRPFVNELNALEKLAKESADQAPILDVALSTIDESIAFSGVASFPCLASRFTNSVAPQLKKVSLLPEHAGVLSYVQSYLLSYLLFEKQGWAEGSDVVSVIARAKFHLLNKDLDQATREVNSLQGWPKALARDWLKAARGHLEVQQALSVVEAETTVQGLKAL